MSGKLFIQKAQHEPKKITICSLAAKHGWNKWCVWPNE